MIPKVAQHKNNAKQFIENVKTNLKERIANLEIFPHSTASTFCAQTKGKHIQLVLLKDYFVWLQAIIPRKLDRTFPQQKVLTPVAPIRILNAEKDAMEVFDFFVKNMRSKLKYHYLFPKVSLQNKYDGYLEIKEFHIQNKPLVRLGTQVNYKEIRESFLTHMEIYFPKGEPKEVLLPLHYTSMYIELRNEYLKQKSLHALEKEILYLARNTTFFLPFFNEQSLFIFDDGKLVVTANDNKRFFARMKYFFDGINYL